MEFNKGRGGGRRDDRPPSRQRPPGVGQNIDANPPAPVPGSGPRNLQETRAWKDSEAGIRRIWNNYLNVLKESFRGMPRASQERLITQFCIIVTMGVAALVTMFFYAFLPLFIRVLALPVILVGSYWAGNRLVAPIMIVRYDEYLNREF